MQGFSFSHSQWRSQSFTGTSKLNEKHFYRKHARKSAFLPETPFHGIAGIFADGPALLPFRCPAPLAAGRAKSEFLPKIAFHETYGKTAGNAILCFWRYRQLIDFKSHWR